VPPLGRDAVQVALHAGLRRAHELRRAGLIHSALLVCQHRFVRTDADVPAQRQIPELGSVFA
jgi:uncharacterized protein